jgi:hypothetical protein
MPLDVIRSALEQIKKHKVGSELRGSGFDIDGTRGRKLSEFSVPDKFSWT